MAEALQGIGNLWDHLTELHHKDPKKYKEIIEDSAKEYAKMKLPPIPHTCIIAKDMVSFVICYLHSNFSKCTFYHFVKYFRLLFLKR